MCIYHSFIISDLKNSFHIVFDLILYVHVVIHHLKYIKSVISLKLQEIDIN